MEVTCGYEVNANTELITQVDKNSYQLIRMNTIVNVNLNEMKVNNNWIHFSRTQGDQTSVLFFCLSASSGTEGIKGVKNFVPFLALYRGFLVPQMPPLEALSTIPLCSDYVV